MNNEKLNKGVRILRIINAIFRAIFSVFTKKKESEEKM